MVIPVPSEDPPPTMATTVRKVTAPLRGTHAVLIQPAVPGPDAAFGGEAVISRLERILVRSPDLQAHVTVLIDGLGWRSVSRWVSYADMTEQDDPLAIVFDPALYSGVAFEEATGMDPVQHIREAVVYFRLAPGAEQAGGCSEAGLRDGTNDCLFKCLQEAFAAHGPALNRAESARLGARPGETLKPISSNACLKRCLGLHEKDKVPLSVLPRLEEMLKTRITVLGRDDEGQPCDANSYISTADYPRRLNLILRNGHYTIARPHILGRTLTPRAKKGRKRVLYADLAATMTTPEQLAQLREWALQPRSAPVLIVPTAYSSMEEYLEIRQGLLDATALDLDCFCGKIASLTMEYFRLRSHLLPVAPPLTAVETRFLLQAARGGLIKSAPKEGWEGCAQAFDFVSFYPSLLMDPHTLLPNCVGEVKQLPAMAPGGQPYKFFSIGIYRAVVRDIPAKYRSLWNQPYGRPAHFTHTDLATALMLGGRVDLVQDGQANAVVYDRRQCISAPDAFRSPIKNLFAAKQQGGKGAKMALNMMTGGLYARRTRRETLHDGAQTSADSGRLVRAMRIRGDWCVETYAEEHEAFSGPYPRFGAFLTAKGRYIMAKTLMPLADRLIRCHTDGFLLRAESADAQVPAALAAKIGTGLGQLKLERSGHCTVKSMRRPQF
eukprot:m.282206 g.282206  ORF g.282206 m.282206 type:complete len:665 (+) comp11110_c0_seq11:211-2205(+)